MTLELSQFDVMTYLWETMDKTEDGEHIRYTPQDIEVLWNMGFVDTVRFPLTIWRAAFEPYREAGGTYLLGHDAFLSLDQYRYTGEIHVPFDPMLINEGRYTDEGFQELCNMSISPSCSLSPEKFQDFLDDLKKTFREPGGLIRIAHDAKIRIKKLLSDHPSPLRNLEVLFDQMIEQQADAKARAELGAADEAQVQRELVRQTSRFGAHPASRTEANFLALKHLTKARAKDGEGPPDGGKPSGTELKRIKRSRKGVRG